MNRFSKLVKNPLLLGGYILHRLAPFIKDDETYLKWYYFFPMRRFPDLKNPKTFNEKLQWLKLHDHNPDYTQMVDKYEVKQYIAEKIGAEYVIPTLGVWDRFEDIDFDKLPNQFVLKCTHDSGGLVICKDKSTLDLKKVRKKINRCLKKDYYIGTREWPYKNVKRRIIAEKYMVDESGTELKDYKFLCFNGKAKYVFVASDRGKEKEVTKFDFYDIEWNLLPFTNGYPNSKKQMKKPEKYEVMIDISQKLSQDIPHVRVDLYNINGRIYFGELTFFQRSGLITFSPPKWDYIIGEELVLPNKGES